MKRRADRRELHVYMDRYVDGDPRAFARLHATLSPRLRGFLMKLVRDEPTVDDLLQLTFLKAHLARERFELPEASEDPDGAVQGWYFAIARNVALDHLRQRGRRERRRVEVGEIDVDLADATASIEALAVDHERAGEIVEQVREAIALLPESQREVVELHKLRGMSMAEVAARLDIREGAARVRAHRGYKALARLLGDRGSAPLAAWLALQARACGINLDSLDVLVSLIDLP